MIPNEYDFSIVHFMYGICGAIYDSIEYAYVLSKFGKTKLTIYIRGNNISAEIANKVIPKKYTLDINNLPFDIEYRKNITIDKNQYKSVLFIDSMSVEILPIYMARKYFIYADYIPNALYLYRKVCDLKNVYTFNEMPFFPSPVNYKFKMGYDIFKTYDRLENNTLISSKEVTSTQILHKTEFVNNDTNEIVHFTWPIEDFNQKFNRYQYYSKNYFDPRPRIFHECAFYGIKNSDIIRKTDIEMKDGAYYKLMSLYDEGYECRNLTVDDELIQMMVNS